MKSRNQIIVNQYDQNTYKIPKEVNATATITGTNTFKIVINVTKMSNDEDQFYLAGFAEGMVTKNQIVDYIAMINLQIPQFVTNQFNQLKQDAELFETYRDYMGWLYGMSNSSGVDVMQIYFLNSMQQLYYATNNDKIEKLQRGFTYIQYKNQSLNVFHANSANYTHALMKIHKVLILHINQQTQRLNYQSMPGLFGSNELLFQIRSNNEQKLIVGTYFPSNGDFRTEGYTEHIYIIYCALFGIEQEIIKPSGMSQFELVEIDYKFKTIIKKQIIDQQIHTIDLTLELLQNGYATLNNFPLYEQARFDIDFNSEFYGENDFRLKQVKEFQQLNIHQIRDKIVQNSHEDPRLPIAGRFDIKHNLTFGLTSLSVVSNDSMQKFSFNYSFGITPTSKNIPFKYKDNLGVTKTYMFITTNEFTFTACGEKMIDCDRCTDSKYSIIENCKTCIDDYVMFVRNGTLTCETFDFETPTILLSIYLMIIVGIAVFWVYWYFIKKPK